MDNSIFREKSLERISSPEQLDDYIKVSNPGVWLIVSALLVLLVGAVAWGFLGKITDTLPCCCVCQDGTAYCYVDETLYSKLNEGLEVTLEGETYIISRIKSPESVSADIDDNFLQSAGLEKGRSAAVAVIENCPLEGVFPGRIIYETVVPISFILG